MSVHVAILLKVPECLDAFLPLFGAHHERTHVHPVLGGIFGSEHHQRIHISYALLFVFLTVRCSVGIVGILLPQF